MKRDALGIAVAGFGWMGRVHTHSYLRVLHHFPQLGVRPELVAVADEVPGRAAEAADRYGFGTATLDWRDLAADPRVRAVSIAAPNFLHREIGAGLARSASTSGSRSRSASTPPTPARSPTRYARAACSARSVSTTATPRRWPPPAT
nr:hypothetical protein GCM10020092_101790 [Actinoplanes digitatis]